MKSYSHAILAAALGFFALTGWLWLDKPKLGVLAAVNFAFAAGFLGRNFWRSYKGYKSDTLS
jgi:hypothetical protein